MLRDAAFLLALLALAWAGAAVARKQLRISGALGAALGFPLALSCLLLLALTTVHLGWVPLWVNLAGAALLLAFLWLLPGEKDNAVEVEDPAFSRACLGGLGALLLLVLFYLHSHQLMETESDFYLHYLETQLFHRQNAQPRNPFFPEYPLQGHFGKHLMLATFSVLLDQDVQRAQWLAELAIVSNSLLLWCLALRRFSGSPRGAVLGAWLVFTGVNVGSRIGLMTTFDTNNGLVYFLLPAVLVVYWELLRRPTARRVVGAGLLTGMHGAVYETNCVVAVGCLVVTAAVAALWDASLPRGRLALRLLAVLATGALLTLAQGGIIRSLAQRSVAAQPERAKALAEQNVSLEVKVRFPKPELLQIRLGAEPYQRFSASFETRPMRALRPRLTEAGYAFIFGPKVLMLHWLPTWLAPLSLAWALRKRRLDGVFLGSFGAIAYVTPGLFNFGPLFEGEYFRWEFAAGVAFAALLGLALGDLWRRDKPLIVAATVALLGANGLAVEKAVNDILVRVQREPVTARRALTLWYPATADWFLSDPQADVIPDDIEATRWLREHAAPGDRMLTDFRSVGHNSMIRESILAGLSGTYAVGHELPASWTPYATAPYLPSSATQAFRQTRDPNLVAGLGVRWLYLDPQSASAPLGIEPAFVSSQGRRAIYEIPTGSPSGPPVTPLELPAEDAPDVTLSAGALPAPDQCQSGVAYPVTLRFSRPLRGWVTPALIGDKGQLLNTLAPLTVRVDGAQVRALFVPPPQEGRFEVQWLFAEGREWRKVGQPQPGEYRLKATVEQRLRALRATRREVEIGNVSALPFQTGGPMKLSWRVFDLERQEYRRWVPEGSKDIELALQPGQRVTVPIELELTPDAQVRVDYFLSAQVGPLIPLLEATPRR